MEYAFPFIKRNITNYHVRITWTTHTALRNYNSLFRTRRNYHRSGGINVFTWKFFWNVKPYSSVYGPSVLLIYTYHLSKLDLLLYTKYRVSTSPFETSVNMYKTTPPYIPEDNLYTVIPRVRLLRRFGLTDILNCHHSPKLPHGAARSASNYWCRCRKFVYKYGSPCISFPYCVTLCDYMNIKLFITFILLFRCD
jgi:hypothetical protein